MRALCADGAEKQAGEAAVSARADHQHVGTLRLGYEHRARRALDNATLYSNPAEIGNRVAERCLERGLGSAVHVAEIGKDSGIQASFYSGCFEGELPGMHGAQCRLAQFRFVHGKLERCLRALRMVDADDDHAHLMPFPRSCAIQAGRQ